MAMFQYCCLACLCCVVELIHSITLRKVKIRQVGIAYMLKIGHFRSLVGMYVTPPPHRCVLGNLMTLYYI